MAIGAVTKYNGLEKQLFDTANRQWNDAAAGNIMFCLAGNGYTPAATHSTTADLADLITVGDGAPIAATTPTIDNTTTPGTTYYSSDHADFGSAVTITAKYLIAVQPVTANTFSATTSKLLFYVDLDTGGASNEVSSSSSIFKINHGTNGWFKTV